MNPDKDEGDTEVIPEAGSLENPETVIEPEAVSEQPTSTTANSADGTEDAAQPDSAAPTDDASRAVGSSQSQPPKGQKRTARQRLRDRLSRFNIYLLLFILVLVIAAIAIVVATFQVHKKNTGNSNNIGNQALSQSALQQLSNSDATVGTSSQTLNVQSNAIFAGQVVIRSNLEVAGTIKVGGTISLPSVTVAGTSTFGQVQAGSVAVSGNTTVQGNLTTQGSLNVSGTGSFGTLSAQHLSVGSLQLNGALVLTSHITAGGPIPRKSDGNALGAGGTSSISGSDTAGTIAINTGSGPAAGCFLTVTFAQSYSGTPRVLLTPVSSAAAGLPYYVTRTSANFSVCTAAPAAAGQNINFDYAIFD